MFRKLHPDVPLTPTNLTALVVSSTPNTRTRKRYCVALSSLARFAGVEFDPKPYTGQYRPGRLNPRDIPTDDAIVEMFHLISNSSWRWAYGMLATYGLRPHELFYLDLTDMPVLNVTDGKTGPRRVWPYLPSWVDKFDLLNTQLPNVSGKNNMTLGMRCDQYFKRVGLPFHLYDLRHAWSIRRNCQSWLAKIPKIAMRHPIPYLLSD